MVPGEVYVTKFAGDSKPCFVRKRQRSTICDTLSSAFGTRASRSNKMMSWSLRNWSHPESDYECYRPARRRRYCFDRPGYLRPGLVPATINQGRLATSISQVCAACGKHRSPAWSSRHPLLPGEMPKPTLCKRCRGKSTSSEESSCARRYHKKKYRHRRHHDSSEEEHCCSPSEHGHSYTYRHSCSGHQHRHPYNRASSSESVNIIVNNASHAIPIVSEPSSFTSEEDIRVVRKTLPRSRSRSVVIEDSRDRHSRRRRSHSSVHVVRSRSPRPSRHSATYDVHPRRRRHRSSSHVSFVDEVDEIPVHRSRRPTFRRVFYDGANSGESETQRLDVTNAAHAAPRIHTVEPSATTRASFTEQAQVASPLSFRDRVSRQRPTLTVVVSSALKRIPRTENASPRSWSSKSTPHREEGKGKGVDTSRHSGSRTSSESPSKRQRQHTELPGSGNYSDYYGESPPFAQSKRLSREPRSRHQGASISTPSHDSGTSSFRSSSIKDLEDLATHLANTKISSPSLSSVTSSQSSTVRVHGSDIDIASHLGPKSTPQTSFDTSATRSISPAPTEGTVEYEIPRRAPTPRIRESDKMYDYTEYPAAALNAYVGGSNDFSHLGFNPFSCADTYHRQDVHKEEPFRSGTVDETGFDYKKSMAELTPQEMEYWARKAAEDISRGHL